MFNLRDIEIDVISETAWAEAGATLGELYYKIANLSNKLAFPAGVSPTLGLGGHISGGGYGNLMRKFGLSSDNVIDAKVVDANGKILDRESMGEDLFWAIQGGGASSFCVVLAWKLKLVQVPELVTVFNVRRTLEQGVTDILYQWQMVVPKIDPNLFIRAMPHVINGSRESNNKTIEVTFVALYLGRANQLVNLVSKSFPLLGLQFQDCIEMPWIKTILHWYGFPKDASIRALLSRTPMTQYYGKFRSDYVQQPIPKEGLEAIWKKMITLEVMFMQFNPYGGKMSEILETKTPFPHRARNLFKIQYNAMWYEDGEEIATRYLNASKELYDTLAPYVSKNPREHFLNYRDIEIGTNKNGNTSFGFQYFKWNLPRLLVTKAKVDPDNFFRFEQSIPVVSRLV
ncbi:hypothetical protein BVRB_7g169600 [Beta vulgaris subsp. vulgaris]|nr:hypothetical protein BVRB_7g169600 [Beta vulgaris subsp. vulgaris]